MSKESKFEQLKRDIHVMILKEIQEAISEKESIRLKNAGLTISKCGRLLANLDETTIKYLMKLTNDYIRAKKEEDEEAIKADFSIFQKYGFNAHILDDRIDKIDWPYKDMWEYNSFGNEIWPNKIQEEVMGIVFSYFECPEEKKLPRVDKILELASKFGVVYHNSGEIMWLKTRYFDDPGDAFRYFSTAIANGLSIDEIISHRKEIDTYMDYYSPPRIPGSFANPDVSTSVTEFVDHLERDHAEMSIKRAEKIYRVMNSRLAQENSRLNSQLSSFVSTDAEVTDVATDSHGAK